MATGDQTIRGNLNVNGTLNVTGVGQSQISDSLRVGNRVAANEYHVHAGGAGYEWVDADGNVNARVISGQFADPTVLNVPSPTLLLRRNPGELWFKGDAGWTKLA